MRRPALVDQTLPRRWTANRFLKLVERGVLGPGDRVELVEGVLVAMPPQNEPHAAGVFRLQYALQRAVGRRALVRIQLPFHAGSHSVPEPDALVVVGAIEDYDEHHPTTGLLVVEVADSSLGFDRLTKRAVYAAAGIPEFWIVNLVSDCVEVRRDPDPATRRYRQVTVARRDATLTIAALPRSRVRVADLLPRRHRKAAPPDDRD